jgi:general control protein GCN4
VDPTRQPRLEIAHHYYLPFRIKSQRPPPRRKKLFLLQPHTLTNTYTTTTNIDSARCFNYPVTVTPPTATITFNTHFPTYPPTTSDIPPESLTFSPASSFRSSPLTANISSQEFNSFTTDPQSKWLPSSSSSLPAQSPQQPQLQDLHPEQQPRQTHSHQDFVLFERSPSVRSTPSLSPRQAYNGQHRRHSSHLSSASSLQNQRVAAIIQSTGHSIHTSSLTNRFNPAQQHQFYASSAPSSTTALQQRQTRPQVPLFSQSTGNVPQNPNMAFNGTFTPTIHSVNTRDSHPADMDLFDEFTALEGGASTSTFSSPAAPAPYDFNANMSSSNSTNMGTVSPQDLLANPYSAPNSSALTNLTSPSTYNESPEYNGDFDVSPFIGNGDLDSALNGDPWYPLFPQDEQADGLTSQPDQSPLLPEEELEVSEHLRNSRRRSGTTSSPTGQHSSVSGIASRKRDKPLPPIIVEDPNDTVAMKRARNTLAARKSRQRKMQRFDELEDRIKKLEEERDHWKGIALERHPQARY